MTNAQDTQSVPRHDVGDLELWRGDLQHIASLQAIIHARDLVAEDVGRLFQYELRLALIASLFPEEQKTGYAALVRGAGLAHAAILSQRYAGRRKEDGTITFAEPGRAPHSFAVEHAGLAYPDWLKGFTLALIVRDGPAINTLATVSSIEVCSRPPEFIDAFWPLYCSAFAAAVVEPEVAPRWIDDAARAMQHAHIAEPTLLNLVHRPILGLLAALAEGNSLAYQQALMDALHAHQRYYSHPSQKRNWNGLLALPLIGLSALAVDRGLTHDVTSDYLPADLVRGEFPRPLTEVIYSYAPMHAGTGEEPGWFLDLEGIPRANREHVIVEQDNRLLARYDIRNAPGLSHAIAEFELPDSHGDTFFAAQSETRLALDVGELLYLAEVYSNQPVNWDDLESLRHYRANLVNALGCVTTALTRLPDEPAGAVEIGSQQGQAMVDAEPGRFQPERIIAYRQVLAAELQRVDATLGGATPRKSDSAEGFGDAARVAAALSIEVIRAQITPLLEALAADISGELVAQLRPREEDYARIFIGAAADIARAVYTTLWTQSPPRTAQPALPVEVRCFVAPAGMLAEDNELSCHFPQGYRAIAQWLQPQRIWVAWKYLQPGELSGQAYNGLVWVDDHWAWVPKPFRVLRVLAEK